MKKIVMTSGVWDLFHIGHLNILKRSKELGDYLIVGVITDEGCEAYKGKKPVIPFEQRLEIVGSIYCVDMVVPQEGTDPTKLIQKYRPQVFTHGDDWPRLLEGHDTLEKYGVEYKLLPYTKGISTSLILERIKQL